MSNWAKAGKLLINIWLVLMVFGIVFTLISAIAVPYMLLFAVGYAIMWYAVLKFMNEVEKEAEEAYLDRKRG